MRDWAFDYTTCLTSSAKQVVLNPTSVHAADPGTNQHVPEQLCVCELLCCSRRSHTAPNQHCSYSTGRSDTLGFSMASAINAICVPKDANIIYSGSGHRLSGCSHVTCHRGLGHCSPGVVAWLGQIEQLHSTRKGSRCCNGKDCTHSTLLSVPCLEAVKYVRVFVHDRHSPATTVR